MNTHTCGARDKGVVCGMPATAPSVASKNGSWYCPAHLEIEQNVLELMSVLDPEGAKQRGYKTQQRLYQLNLTIQELVYVGNALSLAIAVLAMDLGKSHLVTQMLIPQTTALGEDRINAVTQQIHDLVKSAGPAAKSVDLGKVQRG